MTRSVLADTGRMRSLLVLLILAGAPALLHAESYIPPEPMKADVLLVIDSSSSMGDAQARLVAETSFFVDALESHGIDDLHIGVITTDMGTGALDTCGPGEGGALQSAPRGTGCAGPDDAFIQHYVSDYDYREERNYQGTLAETLACIIPVGTTGCDFPQPLAAIQAALDGSVSANDGFLREDAVLAILVYTDSDDCSASDPALFDPAADLGPLSTFRCFQQGALCEQEIDDTARDYTGCTPRPGSPYLAHPADLAVFLQALKYDEKKIVMGVLSGPATPVTVVHDEQGIPALAPACASAGEAIAGEPTPRLRYLAERFPYRWTSGSLCSEASYYDVFSRFAQTIEDAALNVYTPGPGSGSGPGDAGGSPGVADAGGGGGSSMGGCGCSAALTAGQAAGTGLVAWPLALLLGRGRRARAPRRPGRGQRARVACCQVCCSRSKARRARSRASVSLWPRRVPTRSWLRLSI